MDISSAMSRTSSPSGRRAPIGQSSLTLDERNSEPNLLLLCKRHHKIVDDDPNAYTVEQLVSIKRAHGDWLTSVLSIQTPWQTKLYHLYYLNLPRSAF